MNGDRPAGYVRSALLVDFDNVYISLRENDPASAEAFATDPARWSSWLQSSLGGVGPAQDAASSRVVLQRLCYLNPARFGKYRPYFTRAGFRVVDCPALTQQGKNSADIHMVLDALDLLVHPVRYDEFIVFSLDADFSPLFQRLRSYDRRIVMLGSGPSAAALRACCDHVISDDLFVTEALLEDDPRPAQRPARKPPAPVVVPEGGGRDLAALEAEIVVSLREVLAESPEAMKLSPLSARTAGKVGPAAKASDWAGHGSFTKMLSKLDLPDVVLVQDGTWGWAYDPTRHEPPALTAAEPPALGSTEKVIEPPPPATSVPERLSRVLGLPGLSRPEWAVLFRALATSLNGTFNTVGQVERDLAAATGLSRQSVHFVVMGLRLAGYRFTGEAHEEVVLATTFFDNVLRLAQNAQLPLDLDDQRSAREWIVGGLDAAKDTA